MDRNSPWLHFWNGRRQVPPHALGCWRIAVSFGSGEPEGIAEAVIALRGAQAIRFEEVSLQDAVEIQRLLAALVFLLALEWVFRRRTLGY